MTVAQPFGGHSSNRYDGPAGVRGLKIVDVPIDPVELEVDLDSFARSARCETKAGDARPLDDAVPLPDCATWARSSGSGAGRSSSTARTRLGLIAGGQFQDPLREGAAVLTGSAGKTFSGPQSGMIAWDDPELTVPITHAIFPVLAATHQVNRVAALAVAAAELLEFGQLYMAQIVKNARALAAALTGAASRCWPSTKATPARTRSSPMCASSAAGGGGAPAGRANIITNKNLLPDDRPEDWDRPGGLRIGTIEVTRWGMKEPEMARIAGLMADVLHGQRAPGDVQRDAVALRRAFPTLHYCFPLDGAT